LAISSFSMSVGMRLLCSDWIACLVKNFFPEWLSLSQRHSGCSPQAAAMASPIWLQNWYAWWALWLQNWYAWWIGDLNSNNLLLL
jgi:hypothetical protein